LAASLLLATVVLAGCGVLVDGRADRREMAAEAAFPPEGQFISVNDRRVPYVVEGHGPNLILIHGASGNTRDFTYNFVDRVKDRYRVWVFDRPGLGYTDRISPAFEGAANTAAESPQQQAAFLKQAADTLGITRPIVLGHSYGGSVALAWGLDHDPAALVIVSAASNPWPGGLGPLYGFAASSFGGVAMVPLITAFASDAQVNATIGAIFAPQPAPDGYADHVGAALTLRRDTFRANARQVNSLRPHVVAMTQRYVSLTMPVEILHGTADDIVPLAIHSEPLSRQIPGAASTQLEGIGHMPHHVVPDAIVAAIDRAARRAGLR